MAKEKKVVEQEEKQSPDKPQKGSPEWSDYVLGLLTDDEKPDGAPRCDGLRRVAVKLAQENNRMLQFDLVVHHVGPEYAAVTMKINEFGWQWPTTHDTNSGLINNWSLNPTQYLESVYVGSAEVTEKNCDAPYSNYPLASAETRAEGRALKKYLGLVGVLTAEESSKTASLTEIDVSSLGEKSHIVDPQIKFQVRACKSLDLNYKEVVEHVLGMPTDSIHQVSYDDALAINNALNEWKQDSEKKPELSKFDPSWKNYFDQKENE